MPINFFGNELSSRPEDAVDPRPRTLAINRNATTQIDFFAEPTQSPTAVPQAPPSINFFEDDPIKLETAPQETRGIARRVLAAPGDIIRGFGGAALDLAKGVGQSVGLLGSMATALGPPGGGTTNLPQQQGTEAWKALGAGAEQYAENLAQKPVETLRGTAGTLIGGPAGGEFARTGSTEAIRKDPYGTILQTMLAAPVLKPLAYGSIATALTKARPLIEGTAGGQKLLKPIDWLGRKTISKYGWTDEMFGLEAEMAGEKFRRVIQEAKPQALIAGGLAASNPKTASFITPGLNLDIDVLRNLNKGYNKFNAKEVASGPYGVPLTNQMLGKEFTYRKNNLDVVIGKEGFMRYGRADEFNALTAEEQRKILNARTIIDSNTQKLRDVNMISEREAAAGAWSYAYDTYRVFHNEADWINEIKNNPATARIWARAHKKDSKTLKNPLDQTKKATPEQVDNEVWSILQQTNDVFTSDLSGALSGPAGKAVTSLIAKKKIPPEIKDLLGRMGGKFLPVRIGETIERQNAMLLADSMLTRMESMVAKDGRPLIIRREVVPQKPQIAPKQGDQFWSSVDVRTPKLRNIAPAGRDYAVINKGEYSIFGKKWADMQIHPDVADAVYTINAPQVSGVFAKYLQLWKASKVADNPPTHINNMAGDIQYSGFAGASFLNPQNWPSFKEGFADVINFMKTGKLTPKLEQEISRGRMRPGMSAAEMGADYATIMHPGSSRGPEQWIDSYLRWRGQSGLSKIYDLEDQMFRVGTGRALEAKGMYARQADIEINKYFPSYDVTSPVGNFLRGRANLGPLPAWLGAATGGPFTSFPMENMRIALTVAKEHPMRFAAANMFPLTIAALGMGASGLTIEDYNGMLRNQPPHQQGKFLMPVPMPGGKIGFVDWTQMIPGADMLSNREVLGIRNKLGTIKGVPITVPIPQGMIFTGPAWRSEEHTSEL